MSEFRVLGGKGWWFAWSPVFCGRWAFYYAPHMMTLSVPHRRRLVEVTGFTGRTPFEALERLKRAQEASR
jgi:hypothetical protein